MKTKSILSALLVVLVFFEVNAQSVNDYRTKQTGYWTNASTWERWNGSAWVNASTYPQATGSGVITIQAWHEVHVTVANLEVDQVVVWPLGVINIAGSGEIEVEDGPGDDLAVYGNIVDAGDITKGSGSTIVFYAGSKYQHAQDGGRIPESTWYPTSTIEIKDVYDTKPLGLSQSFGNFTWNCTYQTDDINFAGDLTTVQGNFTVTSTNGKELKMSNTATRTINVGGNFVLTNGLFILSGAGADNTLNINGNLTLSGGYFWMSMGAGYATINLKGNFTMNGGEMYQDASYNRANFNFNGTSIQTYYRTAGTLYYGINFTVKSGAVVDFGSSVLGNYLYTTGTFTLESGASIKTAHPDGLSSTGSVGTIQNYGSRSFHANANYYFYKSGSQATGSGLPTTLSGLLAVGTTNNATSLSLTNSPTTINNKLLLVSNNSLNSSLSSGTLVYGSSATLEYQGASSQNTASGEFPASSGPYHLLINNPNGVALHASRSINGTLYLTSGAFSIGANTLTLNGALTITSGSLTGGNTSNLTIGGSGASATLPSITLNNLTINRSNGIILGGNVTTQGTLSLQSGNLSIGTNTMYINGLIIKTSGNLTGGNSSTIVFGGSGAATGLYAITLNTLTINRPNGINMLGNVTVKNTLNLTSGNFSIGSNTLTLDGIFLQTTGSLEGGTNSSLEINENLSSTTLPPVTLNNLTISRTNGATMAGDVSVCGYLNLYLGGLSIGNNTLSISGFINQTSGYLAGGAGSNMIFGSNGYSTLLPGILLNNLYVYRAGGVEPSGDVEVLGNLKTENGLLKITGHILKTGTQTDINTGGILWINTGSQLEIASGTTLNVNSGGLLKVTGDVFYPALVTQNPDSKGYYALSVNSGGTIAAQYATFEYMNYDGILVNEGAQVDVSLSFKSCTFQFGEPGGQLLTINNEQDIAISDAVFPENTWGSNFNVSKNFDYGSVIFENATGLFSGEGYENDPYYRIEWSGGGGGGDIQELTIPEGWSGISTCVVPDVPDVEIMFEPIYNELVMLYNQVGLYWPGQNINTLGEWNVYSGYTIKVTQDVNLVITGTLVAERNVFIKPGWNMVPVFSNVEALPVLLSLPGFVVAKGIATNEILWPEFNIESLEMLNVGKAYLVYSTMPGLLVYPSTDEKTTFRKPASNTNINSPWNAIAFTANSHLVAFSGDYNTTLEPGDFIGAFTKDGLCAGWKEIAGNAKPFALIVNGDDPLTEVADGFAENEQLQFRVYKSSSAKIYDLSVTWNPEMNAGIFTTNGLSEIIAVKAAITDVLPASDTHPVIFPNPSCGIITVGEITTKSVIQVITPSGESVFSTELFTPSQIDLTFLPSGIYFISIKTDKDMFFEKLIIK